MSNDADIIVKDKSAKGSSYVSMARYPQYSCITKNKASDKTKDSPCHVHDIKTLCTSSRLDKTTDIPVKSSVESTPLISKYEPFGSDNTERKTENNQEDGSRVSMIQCAHPSVSSEGDVTIGDSDIVEESDNEI